MCKRLVYLMFLVLVMLVGPVSAANIVWVSATYDTDVDGVQDDLPFEDLLRSLGHEVDVQRGNWTTLDDAKLEILNAADLVIISRSTNSGDYASDATEIAQWNSVETPMILCTAYISRPSRWLWVNSDTINNLTGPAMTVEVPTHPIFRGVTLGAGNSISLVDGTTGTGQTSFAGVTDVGNGTLLVSTGTSTAVAEWAAGVEFYEGAGQTAAGPRMLFCAGTQESGATPQGAFNLTADGQTVFVNAIGYYLGDADGPAINPMPADEGDDVPLNAVLTWTPGPFAVTHDIYFGESLDDVNAASRDNPLDVLVSQGQTDADFDVTGLMDFGMTYYWRVDEVNAAPDSTIYKGKVWSLTAEPFAYAIEGIVATTNLTPGEGQGVENAVNGSGLNDSDEHSANQLDMWTGKADANETPYVAFEFDRVYKMHEMLVWNHNMGFEFILGVGLKDVTIEYSTDGADWTVLGDVQLAQAPGVSTYATSTVPLEGVAAKFIRLAIGSNFGGTEQFGLSEVRFLYIPAHAREPEPVDAATGVDVDAALTWRSARDATSYEVYLATDPNALEMVGTTADSSYNPGGLGFGTTQYWQVVALGESSSWDSDLWSFLTQEFELLDGFEDYDDDVDGGTTIWHAWVDGLWDLAYGGSMVGNDPSPFAEQTIVNNGGQSMPLYYDNSDAPFISEAERTLPTAQNWQANGAETLRVYVRGSSYDFLETGADSLIVGAAGADIWGTADECRFAYKQLTGDGSIIARIDGVDNTNAWAKACVMIRETLDAGAINAMAMVTADGRVGWQYRTETDADTASTRSEPAEVKTPHWVKLTREGNLITASHSADGVTWEPMVEEVTPTDPSFLEIPMAQTVYVGLAFTSHEADVLGQAEFSGVAIEGSVAGQWELAELGIDHPDGTNGADVFYLALEDASGAREVVNVGAAPVGYGAWRAVDVPLSAFASGGVNLSAVKKIAVGIGDPTAGLKGSGVIYIDDVSYGTSAD